jgi:hypothetical protein
VRRKIQTLFRVRESEETAARIATEYHVVTKGQAMTSSSKSRIVKCFGMFAVAAAMHTGANAGSVEGPYLAWINLSADPQPVDTRIRVDRESGRARDRCWGDSSILYMRRQPVGLTKDLVRRAVLEKNPQAMRALNKILRRPLDDLTDGLDGVIVYDDANGPTYYGFTTGSNKLKIKKLPDLKRLEEDVCAVMPAITRKP